MHGLNFLVYKLVRSLVVNLLEIIIEKMCSKHLKEFMETRVIHNIEVCIIGTQRDSTKIGKKYTSTGNGPPKLNNVCKLFLIVFASQT